MHNSRAEKPAKAVHAVKQTRNDTAAHKQAAEGKAVSAQEKQTGADTMAQLNFSRRLAGMLPHLSWMQNC